MGRNQNAFRISKVADLAVGDWIMEGVAINPNHAFKIASVEPTPGDITLLHFVSDKGISRKYREWQQLSFVSGKNTPSVQDTEEVLTKKKNDTKRADKIVQGDTILTKPVGEIKVQEVVQRNGLISVFSSASMSWTSFRPTQLVEYRKAVEAPKAEHPQKLARQIVRGDTILTMPVGEIKVLDVLSREGKVWVYAVAGGDWIEFSPNEVVDYKAVEAPEADLPTKPAKDVVVGETIHVYGHEDFVVRGVYPTTGNVTINTGDATWINVKPNELVTIVKPVPVVQPDTHAASKESIETEIRIAKQRVAHAENELRKATAHQTRMEITLELMEKK